MYQSIRVISEITLYLSKFLRAVCDSDLQDTIAAELV